MKKSLISAALVSVFAATPVLAESSVTLYGLVDAGLNYQRISIDGVRETRTGVESGVSRPSNFGIRGSEDIGGGTRIIFDLSSNFETTTGRLETDNKLFNQRAIIGVANDAYGTLTLGRQNNVASTYYRSIDPFATFYGQAGVGSSFGAANNVRFDNSVLYATPTYSGFSASIGYSFDTGLDGVYANNGYIRSGNDRYFDNNNNQRAFTAGIGYANGPATVVATYDLVKAPNNVPGGTVGSVKQWSLGGSYNFEVVKVSAAFGQTKDGLIGGLDGRSGVLFASGLEANSYMLGASAPVGERGTVLASWQALDPRGTLRDSAEMQNIYSIGYEYGLSKRTTLYAYGSYARDYMMVSGAKSTSVGAGIRHQF